MPTSDDLSGSELRVLCLQERILTLGHSRESGCVNFAGEFRDGPVNDRDVLANGSEMLVQASGLEQKSVGQLTKFNPHRTKENRQVQIRY